MILIIGFGNDLRQDDGAGFYLAKIAEQICWEYDIPVKQIGVQQLLPELALEIAADDVDAVLFTDTRVVVDDCPQAEPCIQISPIVMDANPATIGHYLVPATLLVYASLLYHRQPAAWLITAPGTTFAHGQLLSPVTQKALDCARPQIVELIKQLAPVTHPSPIEM